MLRAACKVPDRKIGCVTRSRSTGSRRDSLPRRTGSRILPFVIALTVVLVPGAALARGGGHGGGGHGGGHAGGHAGGGGSHGSGYSGGYHGSGAHFGGRYGGHLWLGPGYVWAQGTHWGSGLWAWGTDAWLWYPDPWWVASDYPGWVWIGSQDGYWTTADLDDGSSLASPWEAPPLVLPPVAVAAEQ